MRDDRKEVRAFTMIDKYGCVVTIYGTSLADAMANYEEEQEFDEAGIEDERDTF